MTLPRLIQYTRVGCGLCHEMDDALDAAFGDRIDIEHVDVDRDPALVERYGNDVPVLTTVDGTELCRHRLDLATLRAWLSEDDRDAAARA